MWKSYLAAALRNLSRNRMHSAITTASLAIGFAALLTVALIWRFETTADTFWPHAERTYLVTQWDWPTPKPEGEPQTDRAVAAQVGPMAKAGMGEVEAMTRLSDETLPLQRRQILANEQVRWADPNFFQFFPAVALAGDLSTALTQANSIVLTKTLAQKYFGDTPALGQTLSVIEDAASLPVRVSAVIADLPANTHISATGFVSGATAQSALNRPLEPAYTYLLSRPGTSLAALERGLGAIQPPALAPNDRPHLVQYRPLALAKVYLKPGGITYGGSGMRSASRQALIICAILAGVILAVAAINFIALMTARGAGRAIEVGVRKACGARRRDLVAQFMGEALILAGLALLIALALVELILPLVRLVSQPVTLDYVRDAPVLAMVAGGALLIGALAGLYPALALSSYRPGAVLKGGLARTPGSARARQIMVTAQFAPLVFLAIVALVLAQSNLKSERSARALPAGDPLLINEACTPALKAALSAAPGVDSVACPVIDRLRGFNSAIGLAMSDEISTQAIDRKGQPVKVDHGDISDEALRFFDVRMLAGRGFTDTGEDPRAVLINATTATRLGYARPQDALGQRVSWGLETEKPAGAPQTGKAQHSGVIVGVMADRWKPEFESLLYSPIPPADPGGSAAPAKGIGVRLAPKNRDATLAAIDRAWAATGAVRPMDRTFYSQTVETLISGTNLVTGILAACVAVGLVVASLGLFGVAAFLAQQRTKEIGVRKALGASRAAVLRMLAFQFVKPVLFANLIACPVSLTVLALIQSGTPAVNRMALGPDIFAAVLAGSLALALAATFAHAWRATGARPVTALRYE